MKVVAEKDRFAKALQDKLKLLDVAWGDRSLKEQITLLKTTCEEKARHFSSEWEIDITKFFKAQGTYDRSVLEAAE